MTEYERASWLRLLEHRAGDLDHLAESCPVCPGETCVHRQALHAAATAVRINLNDVKARLRHPPAAGSEHGKDRP